SGSISATWVLCSCPTPGLPLRWRRSDASARPWLGGRPVPERGTPVNRGNQPPGDNGEGEEWPSPLPTTNYRLCGCATSASAGRATGEGQSHSSCCQPMSIASGVPVCHILSVASLVCH